MILSNDKYRFDLHEYNDSSNNIYYVDDNRKKYYLGILNGNLNAGAEIIAARNLSNNTAYWYLERANFKKGDVNMDGIIDESDYIIIDKIIKGNIYATVTEKYLADINYDDSITDADYQKVCDMVEK